MGSVRPESRDYLPPGCSVVQRGTDVDDHTATRSLERRECCSAYREAANRVNLHDGTETIYTELICRDLES